MIAKTIEKNSPVPAYLQLRDIIFEQINSEKFDRSCAIPSENQLCKMYKISRITAREAIKILVNENILYTVHGKGTFLRNPAISQDAQSVSSFFSQAEHEGFDAEIEVLDKKLIKCDHILAGQLKTAPGQDIVKLERLKKADGEPVSVEIRYVPLSLCPDILTGKQASESFTKLLKEYYKLKVKDRELFIKPVIPDKRIASLLKLEENEPALKVNEILYLDNKKIIKWEDAILKNGLRLNSKSVLT